MIHVKRKNAWRQRTSWLDIGSASHEARDYIKIHAAKVCDVMTTGVVTVQPGTSLGEVASILETRRIKRVRVTEAGQLVGIVLRAVRRAGRHRTRGD
ncbi:CBS domain-containing protein [Paraburkholderia strydomiana]|uniref:CBS domain-containing protein n=1 Tax=Paraburkholderia strydomiana TaxID=1245417 RepID=UPI0038B8AA9B